MSCLQGSYLSHFGRNNLFCPSGKKRLQHQYSRLSEKEIEIEMSRLHFFSAIVGLKTALKPFKFFGPLLGVKFPLLVHRLNVPKVLFSVGQALPSSSAVQERHEDHVSSKHMVL